DLFELPLDGDAKNSKWVLYAADGQYILGQFDGKAFHKDSGKHQLWWGNFYAAQTYSNAPDGRRVQVGWGQGITFPGMPFNQQMTFPCELTLRKAGDGVRMFARPVKEIATLHGKKHARKGHTLRPGENLLAGVRGELFDVRAEFSVGEAEAFGFVARGTPVVYDVKKERLTCRGVAAPLRPEA